MKWYSRADASRLATSACLFVVLSGPMLVPPVIYAPVASEMAAVPEQVAAFMPAAHALGAFVFALPGGIFMERFGLRTSFGIGTLLTCVFATLQAASTTLWHLVLAQSALGACHCLAGTVGFVAFCNRWFGNSGPSTAIAINFAAFGVAGMLWPPLAATLTTRLSWRAALMASAAVLWCIGLPLAAFGMRDPGAAAPLRRASSVARATESSSVARATESSSEAPAWWLRDHSVLLLALRTPNPRLSLHPEPLTLTLKPQPQTSTFNP